MSAYETGSILKIGFAYSKWPVYIGLIISKGIQSYDLECIFISNFNNRLDIPCKFHLSQNKGTLLLLSVPDSLFK